MLAMLVKEAVLLWCYADANFKTHKNTGGLDIFTSNYYVTLTAANTFLYKTWRYDLFSEGNLRLAEDRLDV